MPAFHACVLRALSRCGSSYLLVLCTSRIFIIITVQLNCRLCTLPQMLLLLLLMLVDQARSVCRPYILLHNNLDEPSNLGFCPDVVGFGNSIDFNKPLQVSCFRTIVLYKRLITMLVGKNTYVQGRPLSLFSFQAHTCKAGNGGDCHFFPEQQTSGAWLLKGLQVRALYIYIYIYIYIPTHTKNDFYP